ncbi:MAG TPA: VOC family protein [Planctomycetota bacterium]|nr:VOC family protein [Planctomycetota bacterium]
MRYKIEVMSMAARKLNKMAAFYTKVFSIRFKTIKLGRGRLYVGKFDGKELVLYQADRKQKAAHNPMHFEIFFPNLKKAMDLAINHGGRTNGQPREDDQVKAVGVFDPDGNFMVFKQKK